MKTHFRNQIDALEHVYNSLDEKSSELLVAQCTKAIKNGRAIIAGGLGKNVPICEKFVGSLNSLGIRGHFLHINSAVHGDLGMIQKGDVVILLSKSGETKEALYLHQFLVERTKNIWLLTCSDDSSHAKLTSQVVVLPIPHEGDVWNLVPNNSSITFLVYLQALCMELVQTLPVKLKTFKKNHPGGHIGELLAKKKQKK